MSEIKEILDNLKEQAIITSENLTLEEKITRLLTINFEPLHIPTILGLIDKEREKFFKIYSKSQEFDKSKITKIKFDHKDNILFQGVEIRKIPDSTNLYKKGLGYFTYFLKKYPKEEDLNLLQNAFNNFYQAAVGFNNYFDAIFGLAMCSILLKEKLEHSREWFAKAYSLNPKETIVKILIMKYDEVLEKYYKEYKEKIE